MKAKTIALGFRLKMREMPRNATGLLGMEKGEEAARRARRMRSERIKETGDWQGYGRGEGDTFTFRRREKKSSQENEDFHRAEHEHGYERCDTEDGTKQRLLEERMTKLG